MDLLHGLLALVAGIGLLDALYFVLVTYDAIPPDPRWLPRVCRMDEKSCAAIVRTREARLLGLPNAVYGLGWYAAVVGAATLAPGALAAGSLVCLLFLAGGAATVGVSLVLIHALLYRLRTPCPLCFLGHAANGAIFVLLLVLCL